MNLIKQTIKKSLALIGIGVYRVERDRPDVPRAHIVRYSPLEYNTKEAGEEVYSDSKRVRKYIDSKRLRFYEELATLTYEKRVDCDDKHIADVGCGTSHLLLAIKRRFHPSSIVL